MTLESNRLTVLGIALIAGWGMMLSFPAVRLLASRPTEFEVKAAYLYNFGRFVEWPSQVSSNSANEFPICILGRDPFGKALDSTIFGEKIEGRAVVARRISAPGEATVCRVLFISSSEDKQVKVILSTLGNLSVLTVSDIPEFLDDGGMVQFVLTDQKIRFKINLSATRQAGLHLSSQLLKVAVEVEGGSRTGD
jgi:hypothetical protein